MRHRRLSSSSIATSNVGGAARSRVVFLLPRLRASSSPSVTLQVKNLKTSSAGQNQRQVHHGMCWRCTGHTRVSGFVQRLHAGETHVDLDHEMYARQWGGLSILPITKIIDLETLLVTSQFHR